MKKNWTASNIENAKHLGTLEVGPQENVFEVLETSDRLVFGGACNAGFLESGFLEKEEWETSDEALQELFSDLECFYQNGPNYVSRIVFNERM
jgi:hypothetical protein